MRGSTHFFATAAICLIALNGAVNSPPAMAQVEEPPEPLPAQHRRTEEEEDKLTAGAMFSAGRTLGQRQQFSQALRRYQRALRYDPHALTALRQMMPLAFQLKRTDEALRHAARFAEQNSVEPALLQYSAAYLAESGDYKRAIKLYQQIVQTMARQKPSADQARAYLDLGRLYYFAERYGDAAAQFEKVMDALEKPDTAVLDEKATKELEGEGGRTYDLMGNVFLEAKQPEAARQAFQRLNKINPDPASLAVNLARVELATGTPQEAVGQLQKYFDSKSSSKGAVPYEVLTAALKELKKSEDLLPRLEALRAEQPENVALAYFLAEQYRSDGNNAKARELLEGALGDKPAPQIWRALIDVYRKTGDADALLKLLAKMVEQAQTLVLPPSEGKELLSDEKIISGVIDAAKKQGEGANADARFALRAAALLAIDAKRWDDARALVDLAIKADPKAGSDLMSVWGLGLLLNEKYEDAATVFQRGIDEKVQGEDDAALYFYLSSALELQGKTDEALQAAGKAIEKQPKDTRFASRPAWILYHAKRYDDALRAYQEIVAKFDDDYSSPDAREAVREARTALSNICDKRHDTAQAVEWLEQILDENPDDPGTNNDLGYLWADANQHLRRAYAMIRFAVENEPENKAFRDSLGWALFRLNRFAEAAEELEKAAAGDNPDGEILAHLGDTYARLGKIDEARSAFARASEAFKKQDDSEKMKIVEKKLAELSELKKSDQATSETQK
jgi:tetratricopeptide (TPR) repeat protein